MRAGDLMNKAQSQGPSEAGGSYPVLPKGWYRAYVKAMELDVVTSNRMGTMAVVALVCKAPDSEEQTEVRAWHGMSHKGTTVGQRRWVEDGHRELGMLLGAVGHPSELEVDVKLVERQVVNVNLIVEKRDDNGEDVNRVVGYAKRGAFVPEPGEAYPRNTGEHRYREQAKGDPTDGFEDPPFVTCEAVARRRSPLASIEAVPW